MKIGIDIDDTIISEIDTLLGCAKLYCMKKEMTYQTTGINDKHTKDMFVGWGIEEELEFWSIYGSKILSLPPRKDAMRFINKAIKHHEVHFISARKDGGFLGVKKFTEEYFDKFNIPNTTITTDVNNKAALCREIGISVFIDDNLHNCECVSKLNIPIYWMKTRANEKQKSNNANIIRINSFDEIKI